MSNRERLYEPIEIDEIYLDGSANRVTIRIGRREDGTLNIYASEGGAYWRLSPDAAKELLAQLTEALGTRTSWVKADGSLDWNAIYEDANMIVEDDITVTPFGPAFTKKGL